jgi:hypothetical protein
MYSYTGFNTATSAVVQTGPGTIHTVVLAAAADAATLILYNNTAGSGTILCKLAAPIGVTAYVQLDIPFSIGCYAALTGTAPNATITLG